MTKWLSVLVVGNKGQTINTMMGALSVMTALDSTLLARIAEEFLIEYPNADTPIGAINADPNPNGTIYALLLPDIIPKYITIIINTVPKIAEIILFTTFTSQLCYINYILK